MRKCREHLLARSRAAAVTAPLAVLPRLGGPEKRLHPELWEHVPDTARRRRLSRTAAPSRP